MYKIENPQEIYVYNSKGNMVDILFSERDLIKFLAEGYSRSYYYFMDNWWDINHNNYFSYLYIDGYGRKLEVRTYKNEAWDYFSRYFRHQVKSEKSYWRRNKTYKGEFRREPVQSLGGKWNRKGPSHHQPRMRQITAMYKNPEYKEFNRGDKIEFPWWDDIYRKPQKCWKEQRKTRHQWKGK